MRGVVKDLLAGAGDVLGVDVQGAAADAGQAASGPASGGWRADR